MEHVLIDYLARLEPVINCGAKLTPSVRLADLGLDSLQMINLFVGLEEDLGLDFEDLEKLMAAEMTTVGALMQTYDAAASA